jgi:acetylglutamate kinase
MKPVVVKVGGGTLAGGALADLPRLVGRGAPVALVHGGGAQLTRMLDALGIRSAFREGLRVTSPEAMEVAEMVFCSLGKALVRQLQSRGVAAAGISGTDGPTLLIEPVPHLGRVGEVREVRPHLVRALWEGGFVPVIAPLGLGPEGAYNVNADSAAASLAAGLGAGTLLLLTDVDGLLEGGRVVSDLTPSECEERIADGTAAGGMVPKLRAAAAAARAGVEARIVNGGREGMLLEAVSGAEAGTLVSEGDVACKR